MGLWWLAGTGFVRARPDPARAGRAVQALLHCCKAFGRLAYAASNTRRRRTDQNRRPAMTTATTAPVGLMFQVVRPTPSTYGDLTCGGVSAEASHLTVVGVVDDDGDCQPLPKTAQVFQARLDAPAVVVDSTTGGWPILVPRLL